MNPFRQKPSFCGPASLKIMFDYYGKNYSEDELGVLCDTTVEEGTNHINLVEGVKKLGFDPITKESATLDDLREWISKGVPIIVGWWSDYEDHYSVVYGLDEKNIYLMDPELDEGRRTMSLEEWEKVWYDFESPEKFRIERWMMVVPPKTESQPNLE